MSYCEDYLDPFDRDEREYLVPEDDEDDEDEWDEKPPDRKAGR